MFLFWVMLLHTGVTFVAAIRVGCWVNVSTWTSPVYSGRTLRACQLGLVRTCVLKKLFFICLLLTLPRCKENPGVNTEPILTFISRFNTVSTWWALALIGRSLKWYVCASHFSRVVTSILAADRIRDRIWVKEKFIQLAEQLEKRNNFSALMAVLAGLNHAVCVLLFYASSQDNVSDLFTGSISIEVHAQGIEKEVPASMYFVEVVLTYQSSLFLIWKRLCHPRRHIAIIVPDWKWLEPLIRPFNFTDPSAGIAACPLYWRWLVRPHFHRWRWGRSFRTVTHLPGNSSKVDGLINWDKRRLIHRVITDLKAGMKSTYQIKLAGFWRINTEPRLT